MIKVKITTTDHKPTGEAKTSEIEKKFASADEFRQYLDVQIHLKSQSEAECKIILISERKGYLEVSKFSFSHIFSEQRIKRVISEIYFEEFDSEWDIIEEYLPGYYSDDRVLKADILYRYYNNEEVNFKDYQNLIQGHTKEEVKNEYDSIVEELYSEAVWAKYEGEKK